MKFHEIRIPYNISLPAEEITQYRISNRTEYLDINGGHKTLKINGRIEVEPFTQRAELVKNSSHIRFNREHGNPRTEMSPKQAKEILLKAVLILRC